MSETTQPSALTPILRRWQNAALPAAVLGIFGVVVGYSVDKSLGHKGFWSHYLYGFLFWMSITLGCTTVTFLHHTIRSHWSLAILRIAEAGNKNMLTMLILFLFVGLGALLGHQVYPWADPEVLHHLHPNKQLWYHPVFWGIRALGYFVYWIITTNKMNRSSAKQDETRDERMAEIRAGQAAPMGVIHVVLLTFAYTDWLMSLDPNWFSTLYGAWHMATQVLATIAMGTFLVLTLRKYKPYADVVTPVLTKDLGNMILGFTMIWGYFTLSQFLIIWSGNLPEEITFFVNRFKGPLVIVGGALVVGQFFGPFLCLLAGKTKRTFDLLQKVAAWIFIARIFDMWWQVVPFLRHDPLAGAGVLFDLAAFVGIGGIWAWGFFRNLRSLDVIPAHDSRLQEAKARLEAHSHA